MFLKMKISDYVSTKKSEFLIRRAVSMETLDRKNLVNWEPWTGCYETSEACLNCYYYGQHSKKTTEKNQNDQSSLYDQNNQNNLTNQNKHRQTYKNIIVKTKDFFKPVQKTAKELYKIPSGKTVVTCFMSDFLLKEADSWRLEMWSIIKQRPDLTFLILTKRIERFCLFLPQDWNDGYENVIIGCTVENQKAADSRLPLFLSYPIKHRFISCVPLLEKINIEPYLKAQTIRHVTVGGEIGKNARECDYDWVADIRNQCLLTKTSFWFKNTGSFFRHNGDIRKVCTIRQNSFARKLKL